MSKKLKQVLGTGGVGESQVTINQQKDTNQVEISDQFDKMELIFQKADNLLYKHQNFQAAENTYREILQLDPNNIDALNSIAQCIKQKHQITKKNNNENTNGQQNQQSTEEFESLRPLYQDILKIDPEDIEANFNLGLLFMANNKDYAQALQYFQQALKKDRPFQQSSSSLSDNNTKQQVLKQKQQEQQNQIREIFRPQFAKCHYNIGMINDRMGELEKARQSYQQAATKCEEDPTKIQIGTQHYLKAMTNLAVVLEKQGKREEALKILLTLQKMQPQANNDKNSIKNGNSKNKNVDKPISNNGSGSVHVYNNLGIIQKRNEEFQAAKASYELALSIESDNFFPNYNLGVLLAEKENYLKDSLNYFSKAQRLAHTSGEIGHEINVHINMGIVYEKLGEIQQAINQLELALVLDKDNHQVIQKISELKLLLNKQQEQDLELQKQQVLKKEQQEQEQQQQEIRTKEQIKDELKQNISHQQVDLPANKSKAIASTIKDDPIVSLPVKEQEVIKSEDQEKTVIDQSNKKQEKGKLQDDKKDQVITPVAKQGASKQSDKRIIQKQINTKNKKSEETKSNPENVSTPKQEIQSLTKNQHQQVIVNSTDIINNQSLKKLEKSNEEKKIEIQGNDSLPAQIKQSLDQQNLDSVKKINSSTSNQQPIILIDQLQEQKPLVIDQEIQNKVSTSSKLKEDRKTAKENANKQQNEITIKAKESSKSIEKNLQQNNEIDIVVQHDITNVQNNDAKKNGVKETVDNVKNLKEQIDDAATDKQEQKEIQQQPEITKNITEEQKASDQNNQLITQNSQDPLIIQDSEVKNRRMSKMSKMSNQSLTNGIGGGTGIIQDLRPIASRQSNRGGLAGTGSYNTQGSRPHTGTQANQTHNPLLEQQHLLTLQLHHNQTTGAVEQIIQASTQGIDLDKQPDEKEQTVVKLELEKEQLENQKEQDDEDQYFQHNGEYEEIEEDQVDKVSVKEETVQEEIIQLSPKNLNGGAEEAAKLLDNEPETHIKATSKVEEKISHQEESKQLDEQVPTQSKPDQMQTAPHEKSDDWQQWSMEQCEAYLKTNIESLEAQYRKGILFVEKAHIQKSLQAQQEEYQNALICFESVYSKNQQFMGEQILEKLGECNYKLDKSEKAIGIYQTLEKLILPKLDHNIQLNIGKCYEKEKMFKEAIQSYILALEIFQKNQVEDDNIRGSLQFRLGWSYIRSGKSNIQIGLEYLQKAHICLPENTEIMLKISVILFKEYNQNEECLQMLQKILKVDPDCVEALLLQAKVQEKLNLNADAINSIEKAIRIISAQDNSTPPSANIFFQLGTVQEKIKEYKKCVLNFKKCLTLDNKHFGACIHLANLLANIGEGQRAAKYFKHAIKIDPESINAHFGMGKALQQYSENKDAPIEHYTKVTTKDPNHFKAHTQLGILYLDREQFDKAAECLRKALEINKQYPLALVSMGNLLFESGHADNAIKYHKQALKFNDKELQALIGLGNAYYDSGSPNESIQFYKKAIEIDDQLSDVHYNLGNALYLVENVDEAITHYKAAIALNPKKSESYYNLGNALCVKQEYPEAIASYQKALDIDPKNGPALYNLGNALYMINKFDEAIQNYLMALDINDKSPECHFNLASAYNDVKQPQKALLHYQKAIQLDSNNIDAYLCMGGVYENMKQIDKAITAFEGALKLEPANPKAKEALKKLKK